MWNLKSVKKNKHRSFRDVEEILYVKSLNSDLVNVKLSKRKC